jgi:Xaa-Pro aminopeptidase
VTGYAARRDRLRSGLAEAGVEALLVSSLSSTRYLTGFTGSHGAVLVMPDAADDRIATDFRYETQTAGECPDVEVRIVRNAVLGLGAVAAEAGIATLGVEAEHLALAQHAELHDAHPGLELVATRGVVEALRRVKDDDELAALAEACRVSDEALALLLPEVAVGRTERELARRLENLMLDLGAEAVAFESIVAGGPHSAVPHHSPTDRPVERGDLLKIDFGARVAGYHADETRTFVVGAEPQDWQREIHALVAEAQQRGRAALAVGASLRDVDHASRGFIADAGHAEHFGHGLGHGVGLDIHEAPFVSATATGILEDRTPVTVEPGIYLPGRGGVRIEDTLVVHAGGPVSLTSTTRELLVL